MIERGDACAGVDILLISGADEVEIFNVEGAEEVEAILALNVPSLVFVGLGLGGASTSSSGATDRLSRLGELDTVKRCARPLKGELFGTNPVAEAAEDAGPLEAED